MPAYSHLVDFKSIALRRSGRDILTNINWHIEPGSHWAVIGANGSGKTTLLQIAGGVLFPSGGEASVLGCRFGATDLFQLRRRIGWVSSALNARMPRIESVMSTVVSGLKATFGLVYEYTPDDAAKASRNLALVGIPGREDAPFGVLSQGEQQKVLFARALMAEPELLILDEPCAGLDLKAREAFLASIDEVITQHSASIIMVTHHIEEIPSSVSNALILKNGTVLKSGGTAITLTSEVLSDAFGIPVTVHREGDRFWARTARMEA